jgi:hypothetical protein
MKTSKEEKGREINTSRKREERKQQEREEGKKQSNFHI